jgi:glycosyltransferase involved in cell wall biosynthesis
MCWGTGNAVPHFFTLPRFAFGQKNTYIISSQFIPRTTLNKQRLFIWSDSPTVNTGFGVVARNLFRDLHEHYDVSILGINYFGFTRYDTSKYFIYSVSQADPMGQSSFQKVLLDARPDKILLFQDIFNIQHILSKLKEIMPAVPVLAYFPIDGTPVNTYWRPGFDTPNKLVTYTQWGVNEICKVHPHLTGTIDYLYHGVDFAIFNRVPNAVRNRHKEEAGWKDRFLIVSNNRFQPRKQLVLALRAAALLVKGYKKCDCGNAYLGSLDTCDLNGCDASHVIDTQPPRLDATIYMHAQIFEQIMGPGVANSLGAAAVNAGFTHDDVPKHVAFFKGNAYETPYSDAEMAMMYNVADVNLSTTVGEGVGLSLIESAACGTTSIAPNNSAIPEMLGSTGHIIPNAAHFSMALDNNHLRPIVSMPHLVDALAVEYDKWLANGRKKVENTAAILRAKELFSWDDKRAKLEQWLTDL